MAFDINHDWQGNLATPRTRIGTAAKTRLLLILCAIWISLGLVGHEPWKPFESTSITIIQSMLTGKNLLDPIATGDSVINNPPLYYLSAALFAKLFSPILAIHDAARIVSGFWMAISLLITGLIGRELWGQGLGRQATLILISTFGLITTAHTLIPEVSAFTGSCLSFYAMTLSFRRPFRAGILLGIGISIGFLSTGLISPLISIITATTLPVLYKTWRSNAYQVTLKIAFMVALAGCLVWPILLWFHSPQALKQWWDLQTQFDSFNHLYFIRTIGWYTWPALPIVAWGVWRFRKDLFSKPRYQLIVCYFLTAFILIGLQPKHMDVSVLPLLIPMIALATGGVETLKRGASGALNWFGLVLFGLGGVLIWLGWFAMMTGHLNKLAARMHFLSGLNQLSTSYLALTIAFLISMIWIITINNKRSNRAAINDWAVGATMSWGLLMLLWLPMIDSAKSYKELMISLERLLPIKTHCINTVGLGKPQQQLLSYYTSLSAKLVQSDHKPANCEFLLVQDTREDHLFEPDKHWRLIWEANRPADRHERFTLYQANQ
jgi:4-amino-4-deoxy-L-arabinose transferase-like glycosyltransferase